MARGEPANSDSDAEDTTVKKKVSSKVTSKSNKESPEVDDDDAKKSNVADEDDEEGESEYEIEEIIEAKRGTFPGGRLGYLVKWKGYDSSHNSWVDERDAANALDVIEAYWKKKRTRSLGSRSMERLKLLPKSSGRNRRARMSLRR